MLSLSLSLAFPSTSGTSDDVPEDRRNGAVVCIPERIRLVPDSNALAMGRSLLLDASLTNARNSKYRSPSASLSLSKLLTASADHPSGESILNAYGIPQKIVSAIESIYANSRCCVRTEDGYTDWFHGFIGVRQGYILSPPFFAVAIDCVLRQAKHGGQGIAWTDDQHLPSLEFADDTAAMPGSIYAGTPALREFSQQSRQRSWTDNYHEEDK